MQLDLETALHIIRDAAAKTASSIRNVDILPPVAEALKVQKAQQAAQRIKAGVGAPERGEDYVFGDF